MGKWVTKSIADFGGLNEDANPLILGENELTEAFNVARVGKSFGTRPGLVYEGATAGEYTAALASNYDIEGLVEYRDRTTATGYLVAVANGNLYTDDTTILVKNSTTAIPVISAHAANGDYRWTFAQHANVLYGAGGNDGDTVISWAGGANTVDKVTFTNIATTAIDAKYIFEKWNYGFLAGMNGTIAEDNPMVVRYSALNDMSSWPPAHTIGGTSTIGGLSSFGDEQITGLGEFTDNKGDWLLILTNKRLYSVLQTPDPFAPFYIDSVIQNGCVHQHAFVSLGTDSGEAVYLSDKGIHSLRQSQQFGSAQDKFLSWKIRETFQGLNHSRLKYACGTYYEEQGLVLFAVPQISNTDNNLILALDVKDIDNLTAESARWYKWEVTTKKVNVMASARAVGSKRSSYIGSNTGDVGRWSVDTFSDFGLPYSVAWTTKHEDFERADMKKGLGDVWVDIRPAGSYNPRVQALYNFGQSSGSAKALALATGSGGVFGTGVFGTATYGGTDTVAQNKVYGTGSGETLAFRFTHSGTDEEFYVLKLTYQARLLGETMTRSAG